MPMARQVQGHKDGAADCDLAGEVNAGSRHRTAQLAQGVRDTRKVWLSGTAGAGFEGPLAIPAAGYMQDVGAGVPVATFMAQGVQHKGRVMVP